jgi:hypothetical protein
MSELFDIPESKSPRLKWQDEHGITCIRTELELPENAWQAMHADTQAITRGPTAEDALTSLALKLNIRLWNEQ